ncbi:type 1 glutamine amidotransferase [Halorubrum sp. JWXQ-INN 858]|uniref:type 1 glutamine amidotransferase n=1 Tax=Halorubrum sp. JWXQ-INN 858 TaxID=2690782 RepID=UPI00135C5801|nr:type 1 glutamine amidotransferase [Halorubrum sp. JWXQ-INN 858]MWV64574.1 type 1 glutamine amidotransferase [Halorubrum sp. JWXQ-INN 858]
MTAAETDAPTIYVVRNEVDPDHEYHCDALAARFPDAIEVDYPAGERVPLESADGVVLTGSTAGVYESDTHPWIDEQEALVRELVERGIPTLGVCFGHQIANSALGGTVEHVGTTAALVEATLDDDPLFDGLSPVVVSLHGDVVTELGAGMSVIASADHAHAFGTRHRTAPLWTVQFHPEVTAALRDRLIADFDWDSASFSFDDVRGEPVFENFARIVAEDAARP